MVNPFSEIDEMMEMKAPFSKIVAHVKSKCRLNLQSGDCLNCPFLPWVLIIMDLYKWKYNEVYK